MSTYYITHSGSIQWHTANATTLAGAKREATKDYGLHTGSKLTIGERVIHNENATEIVDVAVRHGFDKWTDSY